MKVFFDNGLSCFHVGHALDQNYIMIHVVVDVRVKSLSNILVKHLEIEGIVCWSIEVKIIDTLGGEENHSYSVPKIEYQDTRPVAFLFDIRVK